MNYRYVKIFKLLYNSYFSFTYNIITFFILYLVLHNAVQYARYGLHNIVTCSILSIILFDNANIFQKVISFLFSDNIFVGK